MTLVRKRAAEWRGPGATRESQLQRGVLQSVLTVLQVEPDKSRKVWRSFTLTRHGTIVELAPPPLPPAARAR